MIKSGVFLSVVAIFMQQQIIFNPTISLPRGYYFTYPAYSFGVNDLVLFCVTDERQLTIMHKLGLPYVSGSCPDSTPYLIKRVVGAAGDLIEVGENGVKVNGNLYLNSKGLSKYQQTLLRPMVSGRFQLKDGEYFVLGETLHSYDSRYFGIVERGQVYRKARLIFAADKLLW